jgi:hypothetical protein
VSLVDFRVLGFVGALGVVYSINEPLSHSLPLILREQQIDPGQNQHDEKAECRRRERERVGERGRVLLGIIHGG